jgi:hypothetical protein
MGSPNSKVIWVTWSGGIDSTAVLGKLLEDGFIVYPLSIRMGSTMFRHNEGTARVLISAHFKKKYPTLWNDPINIPGSFLNRFSPDGGREIPRRNKHILDYVMTNYVMANDGYYVGMGSHLGAYPGAVDHLDGKDADSRYMISYLLSEYGIGYQLMTLLDFGPSRYKTDRIEMMWETIPLGLAFQTYNCLDALEEDMHCGRCYKCVERHAAFETLLGRDKDQTVYVHPPKDMPYYGGYLEHFKGISPLLSWEDIRIGDQGSHKED